MIGKIMNESETAPKVEITLHLPAELAKRLAYYTDTRRVTVDDIAERLIARFLHHALMRGPAQ
jgi:hypothetical protein